MAGNNLKRFRPRTTTSGHGVEVGSRAAARPESGTVEPRILSGDCPEWHWLRM